MPRVLVGLLLLLAGCAPAAGPDELPTAEPPVTPAAPAPALPTDPAERPTDTPATTPDQPGLTPAPVDTPPATPAAELPDDPWRTVELRDVRSGETLVINELVGRLVVVEPMAIWCTTCRIQQNEAREALASLGRDDIVFISLDVDPNETEADLALYADERDYPWHFVVASREVARSLAETFGDQVLSPPSTPKIVITPDGHAEVSFGIKRADQLEAEFAALLP